MGLCRLLGYCSTNGGEDPSPLLTDPPADGATVSSAVSLSILGGKSGGISVMMLASKHPELTKTLPPLAAEI